MREFEKMIAGEAYNPADKELLNLRIEARTTFEEYNKTSVIDINKRKELLTKLFGKELEGVYIEPNFKCDYGINIYAGKNLYINFDCVILDVAKVIIGDNCFIAPQVGIYTATHPINSDERNKGLEYGKQVTIGNNCWIGGHAVINPGVTLGDNVVVGAGAVVTKSFGSNVVIAGNPARVIKNI